MARRLAVPGAAHEHAGPYPRAGDQADGDPGDDPRERHRASLLLSSLALSGARRQADAPPGSRLANLLLIAMTRRVAGCDTFREADAGTLHVRAPGARRYTLGTCEPRQVLAPGRKSAGRSTGGEHLFRSCGIPFRCHRTLGQMAQCFGDGTADSAGYGGRRSGGRVVSGRTRRRCVVAAAALDSALRFVDSLTPDSALEAAARIDGLPLGQRDELPLAGAPFLAKGGGRPWPARS